MTVSHWACLDSNTPREPAEKRPIPHAGAVKSAVNRADQADSTALLAAIQEVLALPLTDAEKAEAVRRLLGAADRQEAR